METIFCCIWSEKMLKGIVVWAPGAISVHHHMQGEDCYLDKQVLCELLTPFYDDLACCRFIDCPPLIIESAFQIY